MPLQTRQLGVQNPRHQISRLGRVQVLGACHRTQDQCLRYGGGEIVRLVSIVSSTHSEDSFIVPEVGSAQSFKPFVALPLHELLAQLSPEEKKLFDMLDAELDRIESFYLMREKETQERSNLLRGQLNELSEHKKVVQVRY
jgi:hypothetical protein